MDDMLSVLVAIVLLVPAMALVARFPDHVRALFAQRMDDAWPRGMQEEDVARFRWGPSDAESEAPAVARVRGMKVTVASDARGAREDSPRVDRSAPVSSDWDEAAPSAGR